jgi:hypothetical protein
MQNKQERNIDLQDPNYLQIIYIWRKMRKFVSLEDHIKKLR